MIFETIAVIHGIPRHLSFHQQRLDRSRAILNPGMARIDLEKLIIVPEEHRQGLVRCRIDFAGEESSITFAPFKPSLVKHLIIVEADISYQHKWSDRSAFEQLRFLHSEFDDVIISRNGFLTDSTMANLALFDGTHWITPDAPLLPGTTRARLLQAGVLKEAPVHQSELSRYQGVVLLNALRGFNPEAAVQVSTVQLCPA